MSQKKETIILSIALIITASLLGVKWCWVKNNFAVNKPTALSQESNQTGEYPLTRRLLLVIKQNGEINQLLKNGTSLCLKKMKHLF